MIPNGGKIVGATCYINGLAVEGAEEITVPDINVMTTTINPLGANGETEMVLPKLEAMEVEVRATVPDGPIAKAAFNVASLATFEARAAYQITDPVSGGIIAKSDRFVMTCKGAGMATGSQTNDDGGERTYKFKVRGLVYYVGSEEIFRWSGAPNNEFVVDGVDYMAEYRSSLGL